MVRQVLHDSMAEALQSGNALTAGLENAFWLSRSHCPSRYQREAQVVGGGEAQRDPIYAWWHCHFESLCSAVAI